MSPAAAGSNKGPARFSFTTAIPGVAQFAGSPTVYVGADTAMELVDHIQDLLTEIAPKALAEGEIDQTEDAKALLRRFFDDGGLQQASELVMQQFQGTQEVPTPAAQGAPSGPAAPVPQAPATPPVPVAGAPQPGPYQQPVPPQPPPQQYAPQQPYVPPAPQYQPQQQADKSPQGYMKPCAECGTPRSRGPLPGQYGPWFGCPNPACSKGPR